MKLVSIIIVNYNTKDILIDCIRNLQKSDYKNIEIIVVDNGSSDGSYEAVVQNFAEVKAIKSENKGLAVGYNTGLKNSSGEYILYLGSDAFPKENTISGLVEYFDANIEVGAATCKLITRDGKLDMDAHRGFPTPWAALTHFTKLNRIFPKSKIFNQYFLGYKDMDSPHEIDLCISHFMMVRKNVFDKVGLWDEDFFVYGEDVDMCYRIKEAHYKIMYLPQFECLHYKGSSVGIRKESSDVSNATTETRQKMSKERTNAMRLFYKKHYEDKYPGFVTGFILFGIDSLEKFRTSQIK
jgi:GT2 family glycosyltransferase